jgi:phosphoribosyl 1,2-cyclic phosphate phosphodiesterase
MLRITLLGTASSAGVPRIGPVWGACDPANPKNRRRRCALLVERISSKGRTTVLVDTPADLREQLIDAGVGSLDGVLYTHDHADHTHGIDDLRGVFFNMRKRVRVWADPATRRALETRFDYCFAQAQGSLYPAILEPHSIEMPQQFRIDGAGGPIDVQPYWQHHGDGKSLGFRFGKVAYSPDVSDIPEESLASLQGLDLWIVDALRVTPHPSHFSVKQAREWIDRLKVRRAVLTHMTVELDYETLRRQLPSHIEPGYDGMVLEIAD